MLNGRKLSGSGSNQSQPKIFPPGTRSSDSSSALTVKNVKRLEKEYATSKEAFSKQRMQDYIKQTNLVLFSKEMARKTSTQVAWEAEPEGASSSFPSTQSENSKEVCWKTSEEISRKDKLLTAPATDSPSAQPTGSKPKESKQHEDDHPASCFSREHDMEDEMTEAEWNYSDDSLAAREDVMDLLSKDTEARENEGTAKTEEEVMAEDRGENNQADPCEQPQGSLSSLPKSQMRSHCPQEESMTMMGRQLPSAQTRSTKKTFKVERRPVADPLILQPSALSASEQETTWMEESAKCSLCSAPQKPIPTVEDLKEQPQENLFCCRRYKEVFVAVIQELMSKDEAEEQLDIAPHSDPSQDELRSSIKEKLLQQLDEGGFENYKETFQQYVTFLAWTGISFRLSKQNEYAPPLKTAPFKKHNLTSTPLENLLELSKEPVAVHLKHCRSEPVRRCYPDGQTFFILFPDGSGQVYYPSGNVAVLIMFSEEALFTYCILEDSKYPGIRAVFGSHGHGGCFHPDGQLWVTLDPCTGLCLDRAGVSQKRWNWHDFSHHMHSPPFQSLTTKLNSHITVKILAQDQVEVLFTSCSDHIRFNAGSRLKLKDPETSHLLKWPDSEEELFLQAKKIQLMSLLSKIQRVLQHFWQPPSQ